jgi:hypothetical protein
MDTAAIENFAQANGLPIPSTAGKLPPPTGDFMGNDLPPEPNAHLPKAYVPGPHTTITQCATELMKVFAPTKTLFTRGNDLVVIEESDDARHSIRPIKSSEFRSFSEAHVRFRTKRWDKATKTMAEEPCLLSKESAEAIICCRSARESLPTLRSIVSFPRLLPTGSITAQGYDEQAGIFVTGGLDIKEPATAEEACQRLMHLLQDFKFADLSDKSRAIAAVLAPMHRLGPWYGERIVFPSVAIEADMSQTGKGTFVKIVAAIYGEVPSMVAATRGGVGSFDEAFCKAVLRGRVLIQLDNLRGQLNSQLFEAFVTAAGPIHVRALRSDGEVDSRNYLVFLTSNGLETTVDTANRLLVVRLRKQIVGYEWQSWPEGSVLKHIDANRGYYLGCVCKILRTWMAADSPQIACQHDMREFTGAMNWIVQKLFKLPPLVQDHTEIQVRVAKPGVAFLREIALRTKGAEARRTVTDMVDLAVEESISIPGVDEFPSTDEELKKAKLALGRLLKPVFTDSSAVTIDNFTIERRTTNEPRPDGNGTFQKHTYAFTNNSAPPTRGQWSEALRNAQFARNSRQQASAAIHTNQQLEQLEINYGTTGSIFTKTEPTNFSYAVNTNTHHPTALTVPDCAASVTATDN